MIFNCIPEKTALPANSSRRGFNLVKDSKKASSRYCQFETGLMN
jgi:hypothetical protein